ncbi:MAG: hypothetical protein ACYSW3_29315 [Planctomycetota bacterium]|jgi:hypothetical protein
MVATAPLTKKESTKVLKRYQADPIAFQVDCLDVNQDYVWEKMREVAESVRDNPKTAVKAGHGVSKSYGAARIALWFLLCHYPATVITTAPTHNQVEEILWREIRDSFARRKIPINVEATRTRLDLEEKWFALGFSTRPDTVTSEATRFQGFHNDHILVIFDEAAGIDPRIWKAAQHLLTSGHCRWLVIGNPTSDVGDFADCFKEDSAWNQITISVLDTPNYKEGREVIPGVSGIEYEQTVANKYGRDSNEYKIRIKGEIPAYTEGTFYGSRVAQLRRDGHIGDFTQEQTVKVYTAADYGDVYTAIIFFQLIQDTIRIIDYYYDNTGVGIPGYTKVMDVKPYIYDKLQGHWAGPDLDPEKGSNRKSMATGNVIINEFATLGYHMNCVQRHPFNDGIEAVRSIFPKLRINGPKCRDFVEAIKRYKLKKNEALSTEDRTVYYNDPVKDWTCHPADALRHLAMAYRFHLTIEGHQSPIGYPHAIPANVRHHSQHYDRLRHRKRA